MEIIVKGRTKIEEEYSTWKQADLSSNPTCMIPAGRKNWRFGSRVVGWRGYIWMVGRLTLSVIISWKSIGFQVWSPEFRLYFVWTLGKSFHFDHLDFLFSKKWKRWTGISKLLPVLNLWSDYPKEVSKPLETWGWWLQGRSTHSIPWKMFEAPAWSSKWHLLIQDCDHLSFT